MAGTHFYARAPRAIDLQDGTYYVDNNIAKRYYADFVAGARGWKFEGREYTERWLVYSMGADVRYKLGRGEMVVSQLPQMKGRIINADVEDALSR